MKARKDIITSVGLTVLYEPEEPSSAVLDVVFVSGLGGHPMRTWRYRPTPEIPISTRVPKNGSVRGVLRKNSNLNPAFKSTSKLKLTISSEDFQAPQEPQPPPPPSTQTETDVFWPLDLLPESCPTVRIMTWGCHTLVTHGKLPRNQNDIFAHADDLLSELNHVRDETNSIGRPIVFVAHSLGGVIVKEALRRAEADSESYMRDVLPSTAAVMFMATPHRASELGKLTDAVRNMASLTLKIDATDETLQDLTGVRGVELDLGRAAFIRMWNDYNFKVKTFQERHPIRATAEKTNDTRAELAMRFQASFIGDPREQAETFDGNHLDLCQFASADENDYKTFVAALHIYIRDELNRSHQLTHKERECLRALSPPGLSCKEIQPTPSYPGTCLWLYDIPEFRAWHHRKPGGKNKILWIKGRPGSGKTMLLKSLRHRVEKQWGPHGATFVWSGAEGRDLDSVFFLSSQNRQYTPNPATVYRTLLGQLFHHDPRLRRAVLSMYKRGRLSMQEQPLDDAQVVSFFVDDYIDQCIETPSKRTFIFVDAADDCGVLYLQDLVQALSQMAQNSDFSICIASNHHLDSMAMMHDNRRIGRGDDDLYPGGINAIEIVMREHNGDDILRYINLNLIAEWEERNVTVNQIAAKANGVFLWAEIVVNILNLAIEEGAMQELIEDTIADLPGEIEGLYEWILSGQSPAEKAETLVLMQWVILASEPLRLNDLRIAVRLTRPWSLAKGDKPYMALSVEDLPRSIRDLRDCGAKRGSDNTKKGHGNNSTSRTSSTAADFDSPYQFHRWLRRRSVGLLELKPETRDGVANEPLGLQRVQVIHESVRTFFLRGRGFRCLAGDAEAELGDFIDVSHYAMLRACLTYLNMSDFEALGRSGGGGNNNTLGLGGLSSPVLGQEESKFWRRNVHDQRNMIMSSYPFLQYAVDNLLYHLLGPRYFRYFLPQRELLRALAANKCRIWRRWTALLGESDPAAILNRCGSAGDLLSPVYGARFRLERLFRKLNLLSAQEMAHAHGGGTVTSPKTPLSPRSPMSISDRWFWPLSPRSATSGKSFSTITGSAWSVRTPVTPIAPVDIGEGEKLLDFSAWSPM